MRYESSGKDIILYENDLNLSQTLDCGQAFRWEPNEDGSGYTGWYLDRYLEITGENGVFRLKNTSESDFLGIWRDYFDLDTDYSELKRLYSCDPMLKRACEFSGGMRLLRQDGWEALCSYVFSSNNTIHNIKMIIKRLYEHYGHFPSPAELAGESEESLSYLRCGFRAKYIIDAAKKVAEGEVSLERLRELPYESARAELMRIKGVGPKVSDCVLLYGLCRREAFPVDVWIKRAMSRFYPDGLPECTKGTEGIAQLYLYNYIRRSGE